MATRAAERAIEFIQEAIHILAPQASDAGGDAADKTRRNSVQAVLM